MKHEELHRLLSVQHGAISRRQLLAIGFGYRAINRLLTDGRLVERDGSCFVLSGSPATTEQRIILPTLATGGAGIASHRSAAHLWGAWALDDHDDVEVILPSRSGRTVLEGVTVHSPRDQANLAPIRRSGIRVTCATRTLIDFAAVSPGGLRLATERMLLDGHVRRDRLVAAVAQHSARGRRGIGPVRDLLASWPYGDKVAESVLELRLQRLLHDTPLSDYVTQLEVGPFRVDCAWPRWKVILECDGWCKYSTSEYVTRSWRRDSYLQSKGWIVLHFGWDDIMRSPGRVMADIQRAVDSRRPTAR